MADEGRKGFPMMATTHWWSLRKKFRAAIPRDVTPTYLASALGMNANSARTNILPSLRQTGIVDKDGKPTDLAVRWRDDTQYSTVCEDIRKSTYPQELLDLAPDSSTSRGVIQSWFANHTGAGESGAQKMTAFYQMLLEADPAKQLETGSPTPAATRPPRNSKPTARLGSRTPAKQDQVQEAPKHPTPPVKKAPELHINVQVHIAADASADQIDAIFASMAKHLKDVS
jgi:hypothetical protein